MIKKLILFLLFLFPTTQLIYGKQSDTLTIKNFYKEALTSDAGYENLRYLCKNIGHRICGSTQSERAIEWVQKVLGEMELDTLYLQECKVRNWVRGEKEQCYMTSKLFGDREFNICALGTSIGTGSNGIRANIIEVKSLEELKSLGRKAEGKIIFFNNKARQDFYNTFQAYGNAVGPRIIGAIESSKLGATGVIVRSVTLATYEFPHTGVMRYADTVKKIPAVAISTADADLLSEYLRQDSELEVYFRTDCEELPEKTSYNVIGEIKGSAYPDEIILVGGHLDSWDLGEGAHDDGAGIIHAMEVLRIYKALNIKPEHTIRFVAFMDEEISQRGGIKYAEVVRLKGEKHIAAIESDAGGSVPQGFIMEGTEKQFNKISSFKDLLLPYGIYFFRAGGSAVDISFLRDLGFPRIGLICDSQRYFDYHHSGNDTFENIHPRELKLGGAVLTALVYLIDKYGAE